MSRDTISRYRVARLSLYPPSVSGRPANYCLIANTIRAGVPRAQILIDGSLPELPSHPTTEELLEAFDSAIRQHMLGRG